MIALQDKLFVEIDIILRRGGHINRSNLAAYDYMNREFDVLEQFYARYGCAVYRHPDGFFYMTATGGLLRTRLLSKACVHLGTFIALKSRDPEITRSSGRIGRTQLLQDIETSVPRETLLRTYAPKRREVSADASITEEILRSLKILSDLQFIEMTEMTIRPLEAIHRFAEVSRHETSTDDTTRLQLTIQHGVVFDDDSEADEGNDDGNGQD